MKRLHEVLNPPAAERAMLVGHAGAHGLPDLADSMAELAELTRSAGARVIGQMVQRRGTLHPAHFIGKGKLAELGEEVTASNADLAIFDDDLSPAQVRNIEKALGIKAVDRSELILDIFAKRARSREARLQVELAQLQYTLPRLTGMWKHLERQAGGIGTRGPGETQLESDRRRVRERIAFLRRQLDAVERERVTQSKRRQHEGRATLVGYTNTGKSTLFNALTRAQVEARDRLFETLDSVTRRLVSPTQQRVLVSDTVGFIRKLPPHLVASFRSTLKEVVEADCLVHVADASHPAFRPQMGAVEEVLSELSVAPSARLLVLNKCDQVNEDVQAGLRVEFPGALLTSALTGQGLDELRRRLWEAAEHAA